ncbi:MAG: DUF4185 domain-containing protein [Myxococcales bacterium]|nr:DUF4185 domain-containing protein [Myxococcales bacterium]
MRPAWLGLAVAVGCHAEPAADDAVATAGASSSAGEGATTTSSTSSTTTSSGAATDATTGDPADSSTGEPPPTTWTPAFVSRSLVCKLVSSTGIDAPTDNHTHTRFNLRGTDLGVPALLGDRLLLFFGDTVGYRGIWDFGEDPDAVGWIAAADVQADPAALCDGLSFYVTPDVPSVAAGIDPAIERDFAGASMTAPPGEAIGDYIAQGAGPFDFMPGTFEVPTGALADDEGVWLFYAGLVETAPQTRATRNYLARWLAPSAAPLPAYQIVRPIDDLDGGALGGHFIQVAPVVHGDALWLFGTGDYRRSGVHVARLDREAIATGIGTELFDPATQAWRVAADLDAPGRAAIAPSFEEDGVGELSVIWLEDPGLLVALYQRELHGPDGAIVDNRVVLRTAPGPEGPWSDAVTIVDMADPEFAAAHCCGATCEGEEILHCLVAGLYGAYLLPVTEVAVVDGGIEVELPFVVSTWDPYNVVLMVARVRVGVG